MGSKVHFPELQYLPFAVLQVSPPSQEQSAVGFWVIPSVSEHKGSSVHFPTLTVQYCSGSQVGRFDSNSPSVVTTLTSPQVHALSLSVIPSVFPHDGASHNLIIDSRVVTRAGLQTCPLLHVTLARSVVPSASYALHVHGLLTGSRPDVQTSFGEVPFGILHTVV